MRKKISARVRPHGGIRVDWCVRAPPFDTVVWGMGVGDISSVRKKITSAELGCRQRCTRNQSMHQSIFSREWVHALSHEKRCPCNTRTGYYFFSLNPPLRSYERSTCAYICTPRLLLCGIGVFGCAMVYHMHFLLLFCVGIEAHQPGKCGN